MGILWEKGKTSTLAALPGASDVQALGVNSEGTVVGNSFFSENEVRATIWDKTGKRVPLPGFTAKDNSLAVAVNDKGLVAGMTQACPVVWQHGRLLPLQGGKGAALALSQNGVIGGTVEGKPVIWKNAASEPTLLSIPPGFQGQVVAVNDRGQALGVVYNDKHFWPYYWKDGKPQAIDWLIPPGSNFVEIIPRSLNNKGQLVGVGITRSGELRGFVYTP